MSPPKDHRNNGKQGHHHQKPRGSSHENQSSSSGRPNQQSHSNQSSNFRRPSHPNQTSHSSRPNQSSHSSQSRYGSQASTSSASQPSTSGGSRSGNNNNNTGTWPQTPPSSSGKSRNFKLLVDPCLIKGSKKVYRVDGAVPGDNSWTITCLKDPRPSLTRIWTRLEIMELPVPKFKIDENYVGDPPGIEVLLTNLNDNIDHHFLADMLHKFGPTEQLVIYYHPVSHKHLGVARAVFVQVADASACVTNLHMKSVMGKQLNVRLDPFGKECESLVELLTSEKKEVDVPPPPPDPPEESDNKSEEKKNELATPPAKSEEYSASATEELQPIQNHDSMMQLVPSYGYNEAAGAGPSGSIPQALMPPPNMMMPMGPFNQMHQPSHMPYASFPMQPMDHWPLPDMWDMSNMANMAPMPCMWPQPTQWDQHAPFMPQPIMPEQEPTLDLDARIELLLKDTNGQLPHFGVMNNNNTAGLLEEKSDPPLPPNDEPEYIPRPPPSISPCTPPLQPPPSLDQFDPEKYAIMSNPPSPFIGDEEYLESLLNMRLKHLALVKKTEKESRRLKKLENPDLVLDSSSSSDEEKPEEAQISDDDRMSLASMSSNNDKIEEVTEPPETHESTSFNSGALQVDVTPQYQQSLTACPDMRSLMQAPGLAPYGWMPYNPAAAQFNMPRPFWPGHRLGPGPSTPFPINIPRPRPFHPPPLLPPGSYPTPNRYRYRRVTQTPAKPAPVEPAAKESNPIDIIVNLALEQICKLVQSTLENDLHKRMTEAVAFKELDLWWDAEEKKHKEKFQKESQGEKKKEKEETRTTTESLLNAIIDSTEDGYMPSDYGLGFRAALPKLPSFKRKTVEVAPPVIVQCTSGKKDNDSDKEEMVQMSDSDSNSDVDSSSDKLEKTKSKAKLLSSSSSATSSSASRSPSPSSSSESSDSESEPADKSVIKADRKAKSDTPSVSAKKEFLSGATDNVVHRVKEKTPEKRPSPIPLDYFSEEDYSQPPKTPDIHLSETEDVPIPKIPAKEEFGSAGPSDSQRRDTAFQALAVLGLDEFVCDIKFRDGPTKGSSRVVRTPSPTIPLTPTTPEFGEVKETPIKEKKEKRKIRKKKKIREKTEEKSKIIISKKGEEKILKCKKQKASFRKYSDTDSDSSVPSLKHKSSQRTAYENLKKHPKTLYKLRDNLQELVTACSFLTEGLDEEDKGYLKITYERLLTDDNQAADWLNESHWVDYPSTPPGYTSKHKTGCARAEGFYKIDPREKLKNKHHLNKDRPRLSETQNSKLPVAHSQNQMNREVRSNQRRLLTTHGEYCYADLLKFNQLKLRNKSLQFGKSEIHDWGLFALEHIAADEMVIEYVGELIRPEIANVREKAYQTKGIGSSYLFRIDEDTIVDATNRGNPARFINHSCNPNCYAKIITIQGEKKVVIYSKRDIRINEEITYDYKFPFEDEKIPCLCGTTQCKGFLN